MNPRLEEALGSVWVAPDLEDAGDSIHQPGVDVRSLVFLKAKPCRGESDENIVRAAWDFEAVNLFYERYLDVLKARPANIGKRPGDVDALYRWARGERVAWRSAMCRDPMLPNALHPAGYRGPEAFRRRQEALGPGGRRLLEPGANEQP
jgi:DNA-binding transcriptional regulator PaaX